MRSSFDGPFDKLRASELELSSHTYSEHPWNICAGSPGW